MYSEYENIIYKPEVIRGVEKALPVYNISSRSTALKICLSNGGTNEVIRVVTGLDERRFSKMWDTVRKTEISQCFPAVAWLILHPETGQILVHEERYANDFYAKYEGSRSIQMTWQRERDQGQAFERLLRQEVFGKHKYLEMTNLVTPISDGVIGRFMVADALVGLRVGMMTREGLNLDFCSQRVTNIHWESPEVFLKKALSMRAGVEEMVEAVFGGGGYFPHQYRKSDLVLSDLNLQVMAF